MRRPVHTSCLIITAASLVWLSALHANVTRAQFDAPTFEVASVKANRSGSPEQLGGFQPGGRFRTANVPLRQIVAWAYGDRFPVADQQILGGPGWIDVDRFDIDARAEGDPSRDVLQVMLRALLVDRFRLASHEETRQLPVYKLVASDSAPGQVTRLQRSSGDDCRRPGDAGAAGQRACGTVGFVGSRGFATAATMGAVARFLTPAVGRVVIDETHLDGMFTFDITFAPMRLNAAPAPDAADSGQPSLFTALRDQLNLRLEASAAPMQVLVLDRVERPTEN